MYQPCSSKAAYKQQHHAAASVFHSIPGTVVTVHRLCAWQAAATALIATQ
jgi:dihydroxyacetone kinase-like predicted kinase